MKWKFLKHARNSYKLNKVIEWRRRKFKYLRTLWLSELGKHSMKYKGFKSVGIINGTADKKIHR